MNNINYILARYFDTQSILKENQITVIESEVSTKNRNRYQIIIPPEIIDVGFWYSLQFNIISPKNQDNRCKNEALLIVLNTLDNQTIFFEGYYIDFVYDEIIFTQNDEMGNNIYSCTYKIKIKKQ